MATALSININKIALIRNARPGNHPDLTQFARACIDHGAQGITVHPRPDQRHIRPEDCQQLKQLIVSMRNAMPVNEAPRLEFNIEGNPMAPPTPSARADFNDYPGFMAIVEQAGPEQVTLVPDDDEQLTSDHGFDLRGNQRRLRACIEDIHRLGSRVSLFMDPHTEQISRAAELGADRIELYTGPYAEACQQTQSVSRPVFEQHCRAAEHAHALGLGVNAGHDLNLDNLPQYAGLPHLAEVSIGHAFTIDALYLGVAEAILRYRNCLQGSSKL